MNYTVYALFDEREPDVIRYIGLSKDPAGRFRSHLQESRTRKQSYKTNWFRKVASEGAHVAWRTLAVFETLEEAAHAEVEFIRQHQNGRLVNETAGGECLWGIVLSAEARQEWLAIMRSPEYRAKASAALKGRPKTQEHAAKTGLWCKGLPKSPEQRAKISAAKSGRVVITAEMKARISAKLRGRPKSPEHAAKLAAIARSPERRALVAAASRGRVGEKRSPETCAKIGAAMRGRKLSPEHKAKAVAALIGREVTPEHRAKSSASMKAWWARRRNAVA